MSQRICFFFLGALLLPGVARPVSAQPASSEPVVLYRLTRCCPNTAWSEAEYAVLKELDTMDVPVTLRDRKTDLFQTLDDEIAALGRTGNYSILLYFYKDPSHDTLGVRIAVFDEREPDGVRLINYTVSPGTDAVSIVTLKAVEAVREVLFSLPAETTDTAPTPENAPEPSPEARAPERTDKTETAPPPEPAKEDAPAERERRSRRARGKHAPLPPTAPYRFAFGLGAEGGWAPGGAGGSAGIRAVFNGHPVAGLFAELNIATTLWTAEIESETAKAKYRTVHFRAALFWRFLDKYRVHPMLGVFGSAVLTITEGADERAPESVTDIGAVAALGPTVRLGADLSDHWGLTLGTDVSFYLSRVGFVLNGETVAWIDRPMITGNLNLEFRF